MRYSSARHATRRRCRLVVVHRGDPPGLKRSVIMNPASALLLATLMLQSAARLATVGPVAYVCGEESPRQVRLRATRLGIDGEGITLIPETSLDAALAAAEGMGASVVVIDSIQSVYIDGLKTRAGGPAQLAEAGARLVSWAKGNEIATMGIWSPIGGLAENRGVVFTAATINWTLGLSQTEAWNPMDLITRNLLIRLG